MLKLIGIMLLAASALVGLNAGLTTEERTTGAFSDPFLSLQLAANPTNGYVLQTDGTDSSWVATSTLGISGGGASFGQSWQLVNNTFSQSSLAPTTTQNIAVNGTGTSTFAGGLEAWRQLAAPYFHATSTTGTSLFSGFASFANYVNFTPIAAPAHSEGRIYYDSTAKAFSYFNEEADVTLNVGQENFVRVRNTTGSTITNGSAVYISGSTGAALPNIALAQGDVLATSRVIGLATHDIENNSNGYVTSLGLVNDVDTSSFSAGDPLFLSTTVAGGLTATRPTTGFAVVVGYVTVSNPSSGSIKVIPGNTVQRADLATQEEVFGSLTSGFVPYYDGTDFANSPLSVSAGDTTISGETNITNLVATNSTTTSATTTNLFTSGITIASLSGFLKATAGVVATALIDLTADVTGTLPVGNGGTGLSTVATNALLTGNGASALTAESNLTFDGSLLTVTGNASTTQLSSTGAAYFATSGGNVGIGTSTPPNLLSLHGASKKLSVYDTDTSQLRTFTGALEKSFTYATTTAWTGTTTIPFGAAWASQTFSGAKCFTDTGTLNVNINDGTNLSNVLNASTTVGTFSFSSNNTFTASEKRYVSIGTPASSPTSISCTLRYYEN